MFGKLFKKSLPETAGPAEPALPSVKPFSPGRAERVGLLIKARIDLKARDEQKKFESAEQQHFRHMLIDACSRVAGLDGKKKDPAVALNNQLVSNLDQSYAWAIPALEAIALNSDLFPTGLHCLSAISQCTPLQIRPDHRAKWLSHFLMPSSGAAPMDLECASFALRAIARNADMLPEEEAAVLKIAMGEYPSWNGTPRLDPSGVDIRWRALAVLFAFACLKPETLKKILEAKNNTDLLTEAQSCSPAPDSELKQALTGGKKQELFGEHYRLSGWQIQASAAMQTVEPVREGKPPQNLSELPETEQRVYWNLAAGYDKNTSWADYAISMLQRPGAKVLSLPVLLTVFKTTRDQQAMAPFFVKELDKMFSSAGGMELLRFGYACSFSKTRSHAPYYNPFKAFKEEILHRHVPELLKSTDHLKVAAGLAFVNRYDLSKDFRFPELGLVLQNGKLREKVGTISVIWDDTQPYEPVLLEALVAALYDDNKHLRRLASRVLQSKKCGEYLGQAMLKVSEALGKTDDLVVIINLCGVLEQAKAGAWVAREELTKLLASGNNKVVEAACRALGSIGAQASMAVPELRKNLNTRHVLYVCGALGGIGEPSAEAIPDLISLLHSKDSAVRIAACGALEGIGEKAGQSLNDLTLLLFSEDKNLRDAANKAVKAITGGLKQAPGKAPQS